MATIEAVTDPLTGLTNRKGLSMAINEALMSAQQSQNYPCLLMLDIDFFKKINDNFGHLIGDKAIKILADTLKKQIKGKDTGLAGAFEQKLTVSTKFDHAKTL